MVLLLVLPLNKKWSQWWSNLLTAVCVSVCGGPYWRRFTETRMERSMGGSDDAYFDGAVWLQCKSHRRHIDPTSLFKSESAVWIHHDREFIQYDHGIGIPDRDQAPAVGTDRCVKNIDIVYRCAHTSFTDCP